MWDVNQGDEPIQEFCGHELVVNGLAISPGTQTQMHTLKSTESMFILNLLIALSYNLQTLFL